MKMAIFILTLLLGLGINPDGPASDCDKQLFTGFDSRLTVTAIGQVSVAGEAVVGFEVIKDKPVVAFRHRVMAVTKTGTFKWVSPDRILSIAADGKGRLLVQTTKGIVTPSHGTEFTLVPEFAKVPGAILDSGNTNLLAAKKDDHSQATTITAVRPDASEGSLLQVQDPVRALSWNQDGLSMIAGKSLLIGPVSAPKPLLLKSDEGFARAQDSCLAGADRAVVALPNTLFLFTNETGLLVAGISARVRCVGDVLYLLDLHTGIIAKATGMEKIGHKDADQQHARSLLASLPKSTQSTPSDNSKFLEAARIIGCTQATALVEATTR